MVAVLLSLVALAAPGVPVSGHCDAPAAAAGDPWGYALPGEVHVQPWICRSLRRRADDIDLALSVWTVLHEGVHEEQFARGLPLDEHAAECGALRLMPRALERLGVRRARRRMLAGFVRDSIVPEPPPYGGRC